MYDESMKLLKENCDSYLTQLQDAISALSQMRKQNTLSSSNKSMQQSSSPAPNTPDILQSPSSAAATPQMSMMDSYETLLSPKLGSIDKSIYVMQYKNELDARTKDIQLMHEIFFSFYG